MPTIEFSLPATPPEEHEHYRRKVAEAFESAGSLVKAAIAPLPTQTGDGSYIEPVKSTGLLQDLPHMHPGDVKTLLELLKDAVTGSPVDDKSFLMERLVKLASELPLTSKNGARINDGFIQQLYNDLQHPPVAVLGDAHKYRAADGSFNVSCSAFQMLTCFQHCLSSRFPVDKILVAGLRRCHLDHWLTSMLTKLPYLEHYGAQGWSSEYPVCADRTPTDPSPKCSA